MNELSVNVAATTDEDGSSYDAIQLLIDGNSLITLAHQAEQPYALREGHPNIAGAYGWLTASSANQTALASGSKDDEDKIPLLECSCGVPGCWPLLAKVTVSESHVTWSDFEQPHRGPLSAACHWAYGALGPFVFDRKAYDLQVNQITPTGGLRED
jgi:hypothetical protein